MKKNLYYRAVLRRNNPLMELLVTIFLGLASWPRMMLEVFIRRNFGERYFSFTLAMSVTIILGALPYMALSGFRHFGSSELADFIGDNLSWYLYLALFVFFSYIRKEEMKREPSVFEFGKFSLFSGSFLPIFSQLTYGGKNLNTRVIETIIEPLLFFVVGVVAIFLEQNILGWFILVCSVIYCLSYVAAYNIGDNFVMDKIDEIITNEELYDSFVEGVDPKNTRGVNFYGRRPADPEARRKAYESFFEDEDKEDVFDAV
jgi:hypothetical protein